MRESSGPARSRRLAGGGFGLVVVVAASLALLATASCGSRTGLLGRDPCANEGLVRDCNDTCGDGVQQCEDGFWSACEVAETSRRCANSCGTGTQTCTDDKWSECVVPDTTRSCSTACGTGTQFCTGNSWSKCDVPPAERSCEGTCGTGIETCTDGAWGDCDVPPQQFPCENGCGSGIQRCENGEFSHCEVPEVTRDCESVCGMGHEVCSEGAWQPCDAPQPRPPKLSATIRDFKIAHPDFELMVMGSPGDSGIVAFDLGPDGKPVYQGNPTTTTTTGKDNFDQWYRDVPGVNQSTTIELQLEPSRNRAGFFVYDNSAFFPIDGQLWGNEGNPHNYHFTLETHATFYYIGGEIFSFRGDDDMWVFINRRLAIDLGGLHTPESATVSLDSMARRLAITPGTVYPLDFFFAERHTVESNFRLETSIADKGSCD